MALCARGWWSREWISGTGRAREVICTGPQAADPAHRPHQAGGQMLVVGIDPLQVEGQQTVEEATARRPQSAVQAGRQPDQGGGQSAQQRPRQGLQPQTGTGIVGRLGQRQGLGDGPIMPGHRQAYIIQ